MKRSQFILSSLIMIFTAACGQPGPLYLPKKEAPAPAQPAEITKPPQDLEPPPAIVEPDSENKSEPPKDPTP